MTDSTETKRSWRPRHGTVVAYLALFMALATGGAWAAATIGPSDIKDNAIHSRHIKKKAVKTKKIANQAVTTRKLADAAVTGDKVGTDTLTGDNIDESTLGQVPAAAQADLASQANNASALAGIPAAGYQRSCTHGAIGGHVYVKGAANFSASYTSADPPVQDQFNCTGNTPAVRVKRVATGTYFVDFPGINPAINLVATGNVTVDPQGNQDTNDVLTYKLVSDPAINSTVYRVITAAGGTGNPEDREFSFNVAG
jgi:hypothetical protein